MLTMSRAYRVLRKSYQQRKTSSNKRLLFKALGTLARNFSAQCFVLHTLIQDSSVRFSLSLPVVRQRVNDLVERRRTISPLPMDQALQVQKLSSTLQLRPQRRQHRLERVDWGSRVLQQARREVPSRSQLPVCNSFLEVGELC